jgi:hypothetical protein
MLSPGSRDSSVGIPTRLRPGWQISRGSISSSGKEIFIFFITSKTTLEPTQPPTQWVSRVPSPGVKRQGREAEHPIYLLKIW